MCYSSPKISPTAAGASATINVEADRSDQAKRDHLIVRLRNAKYKKERDAADVFNLYVYNSPKNFRELIAAIKDGKFQIDEKIAKKMDARIADGEPTGCHSPFYGIIWDGPQKDEDGYQAFLTDMGTAYTKAKDEILVLPIEKGLEALRTFEALEVTPKA